MKEFYTRDLHSKPKKLPLCLPSGNETDKYLEVVGIDSTQFAEARAQLSRDIVDKDLSDDEKSASYVSCLVVGGDIGKEECSRENIVKLFINAPYIQKAVDTFAANHGNFAKK